MITHLFFLLAHLPRQSVTYYYYRLITSQVFAGKCFNGEIIIFFFFFNSNVQEIPLSLISVQLVFIACSVALKRKLLTNLCSKYENVKSFANIVRPVKTSGMKYDQISNVILVGSRVKNYNVLVGSRKKKKIKNLYLPILTDLKLFVFLSSMIKNCFFFFILGSIKL